ncbi:hypothetical protein SERLA73DRAFT_154688 [Serpula lacrymans var. lacrymans S7.3]|uniref:Uncharacterized protein n=1 Tax=Serpula lacrymans var. lacrymans (strain S7.3) TaxID=936435 RepID=F8Q6V6_SERL3|nr:hypothetical protein SERLA73DRAFT_154688 [Serpula lacrymans var. lacrymans S7.3]
MSQPPYNCVSPQQVMLNPNGAGSPGHYARLQNPPQHPSLQAAVDQSEMPDTFYSVNAIRLRHLPRSNFHTPKHQTIPGIIFSSRGYPGIRVKDILLGQGRAIVDSPHDFIFKGHGWRTTTLNLNYPGYNDPFPWRIDTVDSATKTLMTRFQLVEKLCILIRAFCSQASKLTIQPGYENWALGEDNVRLGDIYLFSIHYYRNVWVPEIYVVE